MLLFIGGSAWRRRTSPDFLCCVHPAACPHLLTDEAAETIRTNRLPETDKALAERRSRVNQARELARLVSPDAMLAEPEWTRSLVTK
jgi:hypothetical protein